MRAEFNHPKKLKIFCICAKDYLLDNIIWLLSIFFFFLKWYVTQLVNTCWLNNMTIFSVINSNGSVNSFKGWRSPNPEGFDIFIASMNEYHLTVSHAFSKTLWLVIAESWYFTNKYILFKSRNIPIMIFGNFIYPLDMKKVKAFWYLFN